MNTQRVQLATPPALSRARLLPHSQRTGLLGEQGQSRHCT